MPSEAGHYGEEGTIKMAPREGTMKSEGTTEFHSLILLGFSHSYVGGCADSTLHLPKASLTNQTADILNETKLALALAVAPSHTQVQLHLASC